jgi:hypothetical protein
MRGMRKLWAAAVALATLSNPASTEACAPAPHEGAFVGVTTEDAIIAFDPTHGREDFIRRATFATEEKDFGFLVPTPTKPELAAAPDAVFDQLAGVVAPKLDIQNKYDEGFEPTMLCPMLGAPMAKSAAVATSAVTVLEQKRVAGYDAAVLAADDAEALAKWLKDHGYAARAALTQWLAPYVAKRWIVTAFKIAPPAEGEAKVVSTEAVRMSFTTDKPFFPYREPADQRENLPASATNAHRTLRVFVLMPDRAAGALEESYVWPGVAKYARPANPAELGALPFTLAPNAWLTSFEDTASPRPGVADLFFAASNDKKELVPPPLKVVHHLPLPVPLDGLVVVTLGLGYAGHRLRKSRRKRADRR